METKRQRERIKLSDEIEHIKEVIKMYHNSFFVPADPRVVHRTSKTKLAFAGDEGDQWSYDCAVSTLARLERAMVLKKRAGANQKKLWGDVKQARQQRRSEAAA